MKTAAFALGLIALPLSVAADPVGLTPDMFSASVPTPSGMVEIARTQDNAARLEGEWTLTSRPCPNFCIQPMIPAPGVTPVGELEVIAALQDPDTVVIDGRIRPEFEAGTIPGAVSVPYTQPPTVWANWAVRPISMAGSARARSRRWSCSATAHGAANPPPPRGG